MPCFSTRVLATPFLQYPSCTTIVRQGKSWLKRCQFFLCDVYRAAADTVPWCGGRTVTGALPGPDCGLYEPCVGDFAEAGSGGAAWYRPAGVTGIDGGGVRYWFDGWRGEWLCDMFCAGRTWRLTRSSCLDNLCRFSWIWSSCFVSSPFCWMTSTSIGSSFCACLYISKVLSVLCSSVAYPTASSKVLNFFLIRFRAKRSSCTPFWNTSTNTSCTCAVWISSYASNAVVFIRSPKFCTDSPLACFRRRHLS